jgi:hypothetical protein
MFTAAGLRALHGLARLEIGRGFRAGLMHRGSDTPCRHRRLSLGDRPPSPPFRERLATGRQGETSPAEQGVAHDPCPADCSGFTQGAELSTCDTRPRTWTSELRRSAPVGIPELCQEAVRTASMHEARAKPQDRPGKRSQAPPRAQDRQQFRNLRPLPHGQGAFDPTTAKGEGATRGECVTGGTFRRATDTGRGPRPFGKRLAMMAAHSRSFAAFLSARSRSVSLAGRAANF